MSFNWFDYYLALAMDAWRKQQQAAHELFKGRISKEEYGWIFMEYRAAAWVFNDYAEANKASPK